MIYAYLHTEWPSQSIVDMHELLYLKLPKISQNRCWQKDIFKNDEKISTLFLKRFQHRRAFTFDTSKVFTRNVAALVPQFKKKWADKNGKMITCMHACMHACMQHFSQASWAKLTPEAKNQHSFNQLHCMLIMLTTGTVQISWNS
jgi:hypothetical protein